MSIRLNPALTRLRASPTLAINERIRDMRAAGEDIVHFGFGQSPFPVPEAMVEAAREAAGEKDYLPAAGLLTLREAAAAYFEPKLGRPVSPERVLVGPGSKTLLFHAFYCHVGPLVIPAASWVSYGPQAALLDKPCHVLPARPDRQFKLVAEDLDEKLAALGPGHQAMVLLNNPNNPTGATYEDAELAELAQVLRRHDALVMADEIYGEVSFDGEYRSIARHAPERSLVTTGLSKAFSAGGYRLGLLLVPEELDALVGPMVNLATETYSSVTCAVQRAATLAYEGSPEIRRHVEDCTAIHARVLGWVAERLEAGGVKAGAAQGAFYLFPDFGAFREACELGDSEVLATRLLEEHKVATLPGTAFFAPPEFLNVRISPVDYDGAHALATYREWKAAGKLADRAAFVAAAAPRVPEGVRRMLALVGG